MSQTLSTIRSRVRDNIVRTDITNAQLNRFINDAQRMICRTHNFDWMATDATANTVNYQESYALPDGTNSLRFKQDIRVDILNSDGYVTPLVRRTRRDIENMSRFRENADGSTSAGCGTPSHYAIAGRTLYLYEAPDHSRNDDTSWTIQIHYYGFLDDLSEDTSTNTLIEDYPELVSAVATGMAFRFAEEEERANYWLRSGEGLLHVAVKADRAAQFSGIETGFEPRSGSGAARRLSESNPWMYL